MTDTSTLRQWDNNHVWHPFAPMQAYREESAPIIVGGEGFFLEDSEGRKYLDGISSLWCNVHGHRVPEIDQAIRQQLDRIGHSTLLGLSNDVSIELAEKLARETPPGLNKVFYSDSGATAVEVALKIAYQFQHQTTKQSTRRNAFVSVSGAYHGDTIGSVSLGGIDVFHHVYRDLLFEKLTVPAPVTLRVPDDQTSDSYLAFCFDELDRVVRENHKRIAGVILEPLVQGAAGILVHPPGYLKKARELTSEYGLLLIADEVAVGFGRTGTLFACEQEQVSPDIMCLAKGITGGYLPLAATLTTDEIYNGFLGEPWEGKTFYHGHTYTGNPLGCAAALASWDLLEQNNVLENARQNADILSEKLAPMKDHPHIAEVRQMGIMIGIELVQSRVDNSPFPTELRLGHQVTLAARKRDVILRPLGDVVVLMPAPAMPAELIQQLADATIDSIEEVLRATSLQ